MNKRRGQAMVELAVCLPVAMLLGLGVAGVVEVADATAGLQAAVSEAVSAAARAPNQAEAQATARARFAAVVADYPIASPVLVLDDGGLARSATITATATGFVDLRWESMAVVPARVDLVARASMRVEPWRTHSAT